MTALDSLRDARTAASALYDKADALDPTNTKLLQQLWQNEVDATNLYWNAVGKALQGDAASITATQNALDAEVATINGQLATLNNIATALKLAGAVVNLATSLAKFFI